MIITTKGHDLQAPFSLDEKVGNVLSAMFKRDRLSLNQVRQKLAKLLDDARREVQIQVKRRDGQTFVIKPVEEKKPPLDVAGVFD